MTITFYVCVGVLCIIPYLFIGVCAAALLEILLERLEWSPKDARGNAQQVFDANWALVLWPITVPMVLAGILVCLVMGALILLWEVCANFCKRKLVFDLPSNLPSWVARTKQWFTRPRKKTPKEPTNPVTF